MRPQKRRRLEALERQAIPDHLPVSLVFLRPGEDAAPAYPQGTIIVQFVAAAAHLPERI